MRGILSAERPYALDRRRFDRALSSPNKSGRYAASALTKEALYLIAQLSWLGLWAAIWAMAGSLASAWLQ